MGPLPIALLAPSHRSKEFHKTIQKISVSSLPGKITIPTEVALCMSVSSVAYNESITHDNTIKSRCGTITPVQSAVEDTLEDTEFSFLLGNH